jgi:RNA polymerase-binding transcription factor DksA
MIGIGQKLLMDAVIKAIGKKSKKKADEIVEKVNKLFSITQNLVERIKKLEDVSHPERDFAVCEKCNEEIKEDK